MSLMDIIAWIIAGLMLVPFAMLTIELLAALLPAPSIANTTDRPQLAVLVPAHNEETGIAQTVEDIIPQLQPGDQLVVIADNCTDRTAEVARNMKATVVERQSINERGKGYALDFGMKHLAANPPAVVIVIDADTRVEKNTIDHLARAVAKTGRPIQGTNVLFAPAGAGPGTRISAFAFFLKNYIRPRGVSRLGLPCLLYGTGMAFPYELLAQANLAHGDITEDIRLGLELALQGSPPKFCPEAQVSGDMPTGDAVAKSQRRRWEHGHLSTLFQHVPRLLWNGITQGRPKLVALAMHIGVPPISFLFLVGVIVLVGLFAFQKNGPAFTLLLGMAITVISASICWMRFGRPILPWTDLVLLPVYVLKKVPLYLGFFTKPQKEWVRTGRTDKANKTE